MSCPSIVRPARRLLARAALSCVAALAIAVPAGPSAASAATGTPAAVPAPSGCGTPPQCFARMTDAQRGVARIRAGFRQTKHVALLKDPLVSTGRFTFERPDRVRWEMVTPEPLIVEIAGASLRAGPPGAVADVDAGPAVGLFRDLGGIFAGASDYAGEQRFTLASGTSGPWSFLLTPRDPSVARVIRAIDIELDPATGGPRRVAITESSGDRTEIELVDVVVERADGDGAPS
ncbi:MAG: outer membrane lipoprotein carrier protein LolA [Candidatus Binatia bacterium]